MLFIIESGTYILIFGSKIDDVNSSSSRNHNHRRRSRSRSSGGRKTNTVFSSGHNKELIGDVVEPAGTHQAIMVGDRN